MSSASSSVLLQGMNQCERMNTRIMRLVAMGERQYAKGQEFMEIIAVNYVDTFNSDVTNSARTMDITLDQLMTVLEVESALAGTGSGSVSLPYMRIEEACETATADALANLTDVQDDLKNLVDLSSFMLSPEGPVVADPSAFFVCSNAAWASDPCCV